MLCKGCAAGRYQNATGQSACRLCDSGELLVTGAMGEHRCTGRQRAVRLIPTPHLTILTACAGTFADTSDRTSCAQCAIGRFAAMQESVSCEQCAAGSYVTSEGQAACTLCTAGTYGVLTGRSDPSTCISWSVPCSRAHPSCANLAPDAHAMTASCPWTHAPELIVAFHDLHSASAVLFSAGLAVSAWRKAPHPSRHVWRARRCPPTACPVRRRASSACPATIRMTKAACLVSSEQPADISQRLAAAGTARPAFPAPALRQTRRPVPAAKHSASCPSAPTALIRQLVPTPAPLRVRLALIASGAR